MLIALVALLPKSGDDIPQRAQTLVDVLRLPQPVFVLPGTACVQPLATGEVDQIQRALAHLAGVCVRAADAQREHRMRARGALVHQSRRDRTPRVCHCEKRVNLGRRAEFLDYSVCDARRPLLVLDLVFLLVEFTFSQ